MCRLCASRRRVYDSAAGSNDCISDSDIFGDNGDDSSEDISCTDLESLKLNQLRDLIVKEKLTISTAVGGGLPGSGPQGGRTLNDIRDDIAMARRQMQICVKMLDNSTIMIKTTKDSTILDIKNQIQKMIHVPTKLMDLSFKDVTCLWTSCLSTRPKAVLLKDELLVHTLNIKNGSALQLYICHVGSDCVSGNKEA